MTKQSLKWTRSPRAFGSRDDVYSSISQGNPLCLLTKVGKSAYSDNVGCMNLPRGETSVAGKLAIFSYCSSGSLFFKSDHLSTSTNTHKRSDVGIALSVPLINFFISNSQ